MFPKLKTLHIVTVDYYALTPSKEKCANLRLSVRTRERKFEVRENLRLGEHLSLYHLNHIILLVRHL